MILILLIIDLLLIVSAWGFWGFFWTCMAILFCMLFGRSGCFPAEIIVMIIGIAAASTIWAMVPGIAIIATIVTLILFAWGVHMAAS